jgi:hypothetical protein
MTDDGRIMSVAGTDYRQPLFPLMMVIHRQLL